MASAATRVMFAIGAAAAVVSLAACGGSRFTNPLCPPDGCPSVSGVVQRCGGPAPGTCSTVAVSSVSLLDTDGRLQATQYPASGHKLHRFDLLAEVPGRYVVETKVDGQRITRDVDLRSGARLRFNLVMQIK